MGASMLRSLINQRLGRYIVKELIGRGGMAAVYRATDTVLRRDVALKLLYPQYGDDADLVERFKREAITAAALEHPHIVPIYDVGEYDGMAFIAMKLLTGRTLQDRLQHEGRIEAQALIAVLAPVAAALDYAHRHGVVHRDIKPGNIYLVHSDAGEQVLLTDFGIAKQLDAPGLTTTGALIGTPDYMAPEQIAGKQLDARCDVYALGMLAFRALTGRRAFEGSTQDVLLGHLYRQPPAPSSLSSDLAPQLDGPILQAIATDPEQRYASAGAFVVALNSVVTGSMAPTRVEPAVTPVLVATASHVPESTTDPTSPGSPYPVEAPAAVGSPRRNSTLLWVVAGLLALVAIGLGAGMVLSRSNGVAVDEPGNVVGLAPSATGTRVPSPTSEPTEVPAVVVPSATPVAIVPTTPLPAASATASPPVVTPAPPPTLAPTVTASAPVPTVPSVTPTVTVSPTVSPSPSASPSPTASASTEPVTTQTATPTVTADPVALCNEDLLQGGFGQLYLENVAVRAGLGCPLEREQAGSAAQQYFERGAMYWWGLNPTELRDTVIVLYGLEAGTYELVPPEAAAALPEPPTPDDPDAPVRGFGRIYFGKAGVQAALGAWIGAEQSLDAGVIQFYEQGVMIYTPIARTGGGGVIFVLYADRSFERYRDPSDS
jgi:serine/threonine protein kinase